MGARPASGALEGDNLDPNVMTRDTGKNAVKFNPEIVERVERMEAAAQAQSFELQTTQESLQTVANKLTIQAVEIDDLVKKLDEVEEAFYHH